MPGDAVVQGLPRVITDARRLAAVRATGLLDSAPLESLDELTDLAARLLEAPLAFLTVVDDRRSYWLSCVGVPPGAPRQNTVQESFCQYVIADRSPLIVGDAAAHPRTRDNPSVTSMGVRAWAGHPLIDTDGQALGSFCVVDTVPREWTQEQVAVLGVLARAAAAQVSLLHLVDSVRESRDRALRLHEREVRTQGRLSRLTTVALELTTAGSVDDLARIVIGKGLPVLGAEGGAVSVRDDDAGVVRLAVSEGLGGHDRLTYEELPLTSRLPAAYVARTGETVLFPDRATGEAWSPEVAVANGDTQRQAWATVPLRIGDQLLGALAVSWQEERTLSEQDLELLQGFAAQCAQSLARIQTAQREKRSAVAAQRLSEELQRSLLTQPPAPGHLSIAVRYQPAAQEAQVGGDWYDAFVTSAGSTFLVIGDVNGHDRTAAATMGQVRNLLRGLAYDSEDSPAVLLSRLDAALSGLQLDTLATAAVARVEASPSDRARGIRRLRWSNAGHLPPLLRAPDGTVRVLSGGDLLLGVDRTAERTERVAELVDDATLLLYTDGLVERRGESLDVGIGELAQVLADVGDQDPEQVCDAVLKAFLQDDNEDDVAILALRANPQWTAPDDLSPRRAPGTGRP